MMSRLLSVTINVLLTVAILTVSAFTIYKLRNAFYQFDTAKMQTQSHEISPKARQLDQILYDNISHFQYIRSFDHLLGKSAHTHGLNMLWVDRCEVRQGDFYKFIKWHDKHPDTMIAAPKQPPNWKYQSSSVSHKVSGRLQAPANGVSYFDAYAYCRASGGRLPSRLEWLAIAGGTEQRLYPWGDQFSATAWQYLDSRLNASQKCGLHSSHNTPNQIHNLGDTVSEWASGDARNPKPSLHGGNAYNKPLNIYSLTYFYRFAPAKYRSPYVGFRCVYEKEPASIAWTGNTPNTVRISPATYRIGLPDDAKIPKLLVHLSEKKINVIKDIFDYSQQAHDFQILSHEITRAQYRRFLDDPLVQFGIYANEKEPKEHNYRPDGWSDTADAKDTLPVTGVDWWSAYAYANWAGGRLPSAIEWMSAASQNGSHVYPWGNDAAKDYAATAESGLVEPQAVRAHPKDVTSNRIYDLGGNVSEWTRSIVIASNHYVAVVKGGNYSLPIDTARVDFENQVPLSLRSPHIGFRIVFHK